LRTRGKLRVRRCLRSATDIDALENCLSKQFPKLNGFKKTLHASSAVARAGLLVGMRTFLKRTFTAYA
jgi:hypothetical protein